MIRFVCVRVGPLYPASYVAILADMIARNASNLDEFSIEAITDAPDELPEGVGYIPADASIPPSWWAKCQLFSPAMPWNEGDRIVYMDLDVVITGRLEDLVETKGIIKDWNWPCYNSSVMVWDHGEHREIWDSLTPERMTRAASPSLAPLLPKGQVNGGDQELITEIGGWNTFPEDWCLSYRSHAVDWPPGGSKVIVFHGSPKPADISDGWVPDVWKIGGFTSLPIMKGVNVSNDEILSNVRINSDRDLPWFTGFGPHDGLAAIVCGGPSMLSRIPAIRLQKRRGARIISVNNAWRVLVANGITPDVHVMLDARPENAEFIMDAPEATRYVIASQCHPSVFDALKDREVVLWHSAFGDGSELREALGDWWDKKPVVMVPGGGTVGLRTLWLCALSGFKTLHVYGLDGSYAGDKHHAYSQPLNDADARMNVTVRGKVYSCAKWMVRQAEEFSWHWTDLKKRGIKLFVHGEGLIPDLADYRRKSEK